MLNEKKVDIDQSLAVHGVDVFVWTSVSMCVCFSVSWC